ncbi:hypothetical protein BOTBODRAFT_559801 [Botryobasidium botryosum FD-172 SS1]|uniref:Uncharacterized protein n=1 Tax=Botryobasidium botryosum (strain FD-172 SS1) TaxID=930990 RepID=A0A067M1V1_BOTB1|nr:hypothetical protein BOTBODRAFT_559801 [Botryobasidium botryosum FD-172 SS1]
MPGQHFACTFHNNRTTTPFCPIIRKRISPDMPSNSTTPATSPSLYQHDERGEGAIAAPQQSRNKRAPDDPEQGGHPPSSKEVLAEIDPFLYAIDAFEWRECVRHVVLVNIHRTSQEHTRADTLFRPGFKAKLMSITDTWCSSRFWEGKACSDKRIYPPEANPGMFKERSIPALIALVDLLVSAGMGIEGDLRVTPEIGLRQTSPSGFRGYTWRRTPLNAVINRICAVERMIYEPAPGRVYDRGSLAIRLDYLFGVFKVLVSAGASCCAHDPSLHGSLELACTSPWQCGPSSHSGRIFSLLLSARASLCPDCRELEEVAWNHSAWKFEQLMQLRAHDLKKDLVGVLFSAVSMP